MKRFRSLFFTFLAMIAAVCAITVSSADAEKPIIILDPGHGGVDAGTTSGIRYEKTYNLIIAEHLRDLLLDHGGFEVYMTREDDDSFPKFLPRALLIVEHDADLLLSLHCNSATVDYSNGALAITSVIEPYSAFGLGESILERISDATGLKNKGVETNLDTGDSLGVYYWNSEKNWDMPGASYLKTVSDYYSMNTWSSKFGVPSLIIEHGYLSNPGDRAIIDKDENLLKMAQAEAEALIEYYYGHTHSYTAEKVVDFPSNCSMNGTKSYHCTVCGIKKDTEPLPAEPEAHYFRQSASKLATCTEDGFIEYVCQISYNLNDKGYTTPVHTHSEILPKKEHAYKVISETPPTCTEEGSTTFSCPLCSNTYTEAVPPLGHTTDENGSCITCGSGSSADAPPAETAPPETVSAGECVHAFEEISRSAPTCEADGILTSACTLCGEETEEKTASPLGHDYIVSLDTPASCEKDGYYRARCHRCGNELTGTRPATGHSYDVVSENEEEISLVCRICGHGTTEQKERRSIRDILTSPLFLVIAGVVLLQAVLLVGFNLYRRKVHKTRARANTYNIEDFEENDTDITP